MPPTPSVSVLPLDEEPIVSELFGPERLEQHAESLAAAQTVTVGKDSGEPLIQRVADNGQSLVESYRATARAIQEEHIITPAEEWLVDNFYIVEEQLREIRDDLPVAFYQKLPKLASGPLKGYPRVYGIAWAFVAHSDSHFDPELLHRFVAAYQRVQPLTIGELWAVAITLRVVLIENLRRLATRIVSSRTARREADLVADKLLGTAGQEAISPATVLRDFERKPLERAFAVQLIQRLRDLDPKVGPILVWVDDRLSEQGTTADEIVRAEHQQQAATSVTVRNIITSMRLTSSFDWHDFFENASLVDRILRENSHFGAMDFATRDAYRHAIEKLAHGSGKTELEVAEAAIEEAHRRLASSSTNSSVHEELFADPGYFLIGDGRKHFEQDVGFRVSGDQKLLRFFVRMAAPSYIGGILLLTALILVLPLTVSQRDGLGILSLVVLGFLAAIPASDLATALMNRAVTGVLGPRLVPRLEIKKIPDDLRTVVTIPALLASEDVLHELIERLEIHYLANPDDNLKFVLLTDFLDAPSEKTPNDQHLLEMAAGEIVRLNREHGKPVGGGDRFFLLHRKRVWNESEQKWMGWERKRGKLHEMNQLLRGAQETTFITTNDLPPNAIPGIRYVITLDADTRLPRGAAAKLIGTMAHPLNQARFDSELSRVVEGYGIVQPRVTPSLPLDSTESIFQRIFSGPSGVDPYASAISDVYQDLFQEGSYTGKGIYDLDIYEKALAGKIPENVVLSHDLFESIFARAALATDIEVFDEFPTNFEVAAARQYRWARGDWQLLRWILTGRANSANGQIVRIPAIGRWKMFDNLRRSLVPPTMLLTLVVGWLVPGVSPWLWTSFVVAMIAIPAFIPFLTGIRLSWNGVSKRSEIRSSLSDLYLGFAQTSLTITLLAFQAWLMADAILRTLIRLLFTHRHLLEWVTAAQAKHAVDLKPLGIAQRMSGGILIAIASLSVVGLAGNHYGLTAAIPFVLLWCASPAVTYWISRPSQPIDTQTLTAVTSQELRTVARKTWRFFETFVTPEDNFLPPDNFQEDPSPVVAHRTSPTNIGLYMLSASAACDFHWIGIHELADRLENTLSTLEKLEKQKGHLFNWYDTQSLRPLEPKYISSVDSGNMAGHLLAIAAGCRELLDRPFVQRDIFAGIEDAIRPLREAAAKISDDSRARGVTLQQLHGAIDRLSASIKAPGDIRRLGMEISAVSEAAHNVADIAQTLAQELKDPTSAEVQGWAQCLDACVKSHLRDANLFLPWLESRPQSPARISSFLDSRVPEWPAINPFFSPKDTIGNASQRFSGAVQALSSSAGLKDGSSLSKERAARIEALVRCINRAKAEAEILHKRLLAIAERCEEMFEAMDFEFLYDHSRKLFSIGFRPSDGQLDPNHYDLLASEARLTSFIAIAKGDVPSSQWFQLGRPLTPVGKGSALISWSGSMFEYLMPALVMHSPSNSLLSQTYEHVVSRQIEYGNERGVPWGISESAFAVRDVNFTYQYKAFGVPGLGLKRGLSEDLVIAPYATVLAAMVDPQAVRDNIDRLATEGAGGAYGLYEALDYTPSHLAEGQKVAIVRSYMAHHQGMSIIALANAVMDNVMCRRFHSVPMVRATELLLQERTPRNVLVARPRAEEVEATANVRELVPPIARRFTNPNEPLPQTALLSNGRYVVMLTAAGSGYSRWREIAVTRWREDRTRDCWGSYIYLRDERTGDVWSPGYQPTSVEPGSYEAAFYEDRAEFIRRDRSLITKMEVIVSPEDDAEIRRISITNTGIRARDIQVTSFAEISLTTQAADVAHPAFANLFVETEFVADAEVLLATRRPRSSDEVRIWAAQVVTVEGETVGDLQYETDRARFIGRTRDARNPISVMDGRPLSNTVGSVLDPAMSLRRTVHVPAGEAVHLIFSTVVAMNRDDVLNLADKYRDARAYDRARALAWTRSQVQLHHLGISGEEAQLFQRLASSVLYSDPTMRPNSAALGSVRLERSTLWSQGISGDLPIVVARIADTDNFEMIRQLLRAHEYWRTKQLSADVIIVNERATSYMQDLQDSLESLVHGSQLRLSPDTAAASGKIFLLRSDLLSPQVDAQIQAAARVVLLGRRGTLSEQLGRSRYPQAAVEWPTVKPQKPQAVSEVDEQPVLQFFNGLGGFSSDGREYTVILKDGLSTPEPWINVIANPNFGFLASESGSGFTWSGNSHENQITPWSNDHVIDPSGEAFYLRDENTGDVWTPTALPIRHEAGTYVASHGQGYSRFEHTDYGITAELKQFVPIDDSIKISWLTLRNLSGSTRKISITAYVEWLLGSIRTGSTPYIVTEVDPTTKAVLARSMWGGEFGGRVAFADLGGLQNSFTCDRTEFLGRNGLPDAPAAMQTGHRLSGHSGAALDPCAALRTTIEIRPGGSIDVRFLLGQTESKEESVKLLNRYRSVDLNRSFKDVQNHWDEVLGTVEVKTPEPSMDIMLNRWLLYQTLSCRIWARAAFYQLSGAYGFRDQLQDVMALTVSKRTIIREHLLRAAGRQFAEGDVQHWWHPPSGRGVRTRISDDLLWLPYTVIQFLETTDDRAILDETVPFLEGEPLSVHQNESYFEPRVSENRVTLYEHCARALDRSLAVGEHGLPLIGTGDWNDGFNRVGEGGKGESIWLGWFLHTVLWEFAKIADARGEKERAETWRLHVIALKASLEREGWDGEWYRRAYFDDGTPLGSAKNSECQIDSIAQTWAVITGGAEPNRAAKAMAAVDQRLISRKDGLILLLTPPFDRSSPDPGYIKGYVPGIRENGGQYSHAAVWTLIAFAAMSDGDKAGEIFRMMNPINRSDSRAGVQKYKVEPYVVAGDIYSETPHAGRGGWTWYTGSAGWLYRGGIEWILGLRLRGMTLSMDPCIPRNWPNYSIRFRYHSAIYEISVQNPSNVTRGVALTEMDGKLLSSSANIPLADDGQTHTIRIVLG
jgi:cyclic beta-1,2-glucan synthetase